nr:MAG TPA: hypothetical protein [Caudoviricetes sp.]
MLSDLSEGVQQLIYEVHRFLRERQLASPTVVIYHLLPAVLLSRN